ncbi:lysine-rich nucleolar protein 1 [Sceloporus undulatus]|uniref:lysine-rich nucleolar protein 1 n=1 Tax=Sceloporus undulatus TaxID=8520 RepID=UPI001C4C7041|nr:lysine-rich nucleolar protein 1 [Sceloporus undulatus]XP_042336795.1 lysine-rich nucleolar protein 1 [Sceloporus undulatus]
MAIKKAEKNKPDEAVQRTNKAKTLVDNQVIIIDDDENDDDDDDDGCSDLKVKEVKKKKDLVERDGSYRKGVRKKVKKRNYSDTKNKACANLPIIIESSSDSERLTKNGEIGKKLKKKRKHRLASEGDCEVLCKGLLQETSFLRLSSKGKSPGSHGDSGDCIKKGKKKKKKKKKHKPSFSQLHGEGNEVESQKQIIPILETISQDAMLSGRKKRQVPNKNNVSHTVKRKKVLHCLTAVDGEEVSNRIPHKDISNLENHRKRRKAQDPAAQVSEEESGEIRKKWKKKKLKKKKAYLLVTSLETQENDSGVSNESLPEPKSRQTQVFREEKTDLIPDTEGAGRVTKKKSICTKAVCNHPALLEDNEDRSATEGRKKKVKKHKGIQECPESGNSGRCENSSKHHIKKKGKKKNRKSVDIGEEEPSLKKRRLKKEAEVREDEIKVVAFKKGNCDEINIDKLRRQALQEEIDRESGKTKLIKEDGESGNDFGQWGTAVFESSERKTKFLRLLGGFKKGSSLPLQDPPVHATKLNMALDWNREQNLQRDLQAEFEKAIDQKHHHRGFGFQPATQKLMWIDKNASNSIKFED